MMTRDFFFRPKICLEPGNYGLEKKEPEKRPGISETTLHLSATCCFSALIVTFVFTPWATLLQTSVNVKFILSVKK